MFSLEEYVQAMEKRNHQSAIGEGGSDLVTSEDVYTQLRERENDLHIAAELGNALLEKNKRLERQMDTIVEDMTKKLEEAEQDRHSLKRKFTNLESEYELRIVELQNDVGELSEKLASKDADKKKWEKDSRGLVAELTAQNTRLTVQLKESNIQENQLQQQLEQLREQHAMGKASLHEHVTSVEGLREELELVNSKRAELERRLQASATEREQMARALEEAGDQLVSLERRTREQETRYLHSLNENGIGNPDQSLEERLNGSSPSSALSPHFNTTSSPRSLLAEMDITEPTLSQECLAVYRQLRALCQQLRSQRHLYGDTAVSSDDDSGLHSDCSTVSLLIGDGEDGTLSTEMAVDNAGFSSGLLNEAAQELVQLVLHTDVVRLMDRLERAHSEIRQRDDELRRRSDLINELQTKVSVSQVELQAALEERDRARNDASHSSLAGDEAVVKAREDRDAAVTRTHKAEVELARIRVEFMQANSQLLESIQQKVELSQQLEQWQMDMHELLDEQLRNKLTNTEMRGKTASSDKPAASTRMRLLNWFPQKMFQSTPATTS